MSGVVVASVIGHVRAEVARQPRCPADTLLMPSFLAAVRTSTAVRSVRGVLDADELRLRRAYGLAEDAPRDPRSRTLVLRRGRSPRLETLGPATSGVFDRRIVTDVRQLLAPDAVERLRALGFRREPSSDPGLVQLIKTSVDAEMARRLGRLAAKPSMPELPPALIRAADPGLLKPFERYVQRASFFHDERGELEDVVLRTYSWPTAGCGMNEERISLELASMRVQSVLYNTGLDRSVAVPLAVNQAFDAFLR